MQFKLQREWTSTSTILSDVTAFTTATATNPYTTREKPIFFIYFFSISYLSQDCLILIIPLALSRHQLEALKLGVRVPHCNSQNAVVFCLPTGIYDMTLPVPLHSRMRFPRPEAGVYSARAIRNSSESNYTIKLDCASHQSPALTARSILFTNGFDLVCTTQNAQAERNGRAMGLRRQNSAGIWKASVYSGFKRP